MCVCLVILYDDEDRTSRIGNISARWHFFKAARQHSRITCTIEEIMDMTTNACCAECGERGPSVSRHVKLVCTPGIAAPRAKGIIGRSTKLHVIASRRATR